ncbi:MAG: hypothetical protein VX871_02715 [Pseudomonadota bacterium]|nr:hypothetical protein [Pseudomonadota bacterium]
MAISRTELELLKLDPESVFKSPQDVAARSDLSREQMREILDAWADMLRLRMRQSGGEEAALRASLRLIASLQRRLR